MGQEDVISAAHLVLCCATGKSIGQRMDKNFTTPGMHANLFIHGIIGFLHYQNPRLGTEVKPIFELTSKATRYLPLPCLMADITRSDSTRSSIHLISGLVPLVLALTGQDNPHLGNLIIAINIVALCHHAHTQNREWGWYTAGAAVFAYFCAPKMGQITYPLALALLDFCAVKLYHTPADALPRA